MNFKNLFFYFYLLVILITTGCSIYSFSGSSIPKNAKTVHINPVENISNLSNPELMQLITEKMNNYILKETKLELLENTEKRGADLLFSGKITKYNVSPISINSEDNASQNRLLIELEVSYKNTLDPSNDFIKKISNYTDFNSSENFLDIEEDLNTLIIDKLVEDIFYLSFSIW